MDAPPPEPIATLQDHCKVVALEFMKMHPVVSKLENPELQSICLKSLHAMTTELEVIKKKLIRLQQRDGSSEL